MPQTPPALRLLFLLCAFVVVCLLLLGLSRAGLALLYAGRVAAVDGWLPLLWLGLRFDSMLLAMLLVLPFSLTPLFALGRPLLALWRPLLALWLTLCFAALLFMELSTPAFVEQYDARPNYLFVEYLKYPREVFATLWQAYRGQLLLAAVLVPLAAWLCLRALRRPLADLRPLPAWQALPLASLMFALLALTARGTLDHRPVNPSVAAFSTDAMVNDLAMNSSYSLLYAIYESHHQQASAAAYGELPPAQVLAEVRAGLRRANGLQAQDFTDPAIPTLHRQQPTRRPARKKNIVIILEESLGAEFVGRLGGLPLTPNLDQLANEGIWFEQLYATGTRSVRGIEAVITGFLPTPARSVVKLGGAQRDFFTLAELLRRQGYATSFIYGGESQFDNMRRFMMNNGFERVIDENDFENPSFVGSWGVSDEDLLQRAHAEFSAAGGHPFFSLVFTSSNHSPFEYPAGRIEPYDAEPHTVNNAVKYADHALGEFFATAHRADYWDDTLFLVVADHNSRVYGDSLLPVERFHIPGLILGGGVAAQHIDVLSSQIDLLPTLLSLAGIEAEHPAIGRDLTVAQNRLGGDAQLGRSIMQFHAVQAYREGEALILLRKGLPAAQFDYIDGHLRPAGALNPALRRRALAHALWASHSYANGEYRLPAETADGS